MVRTRDCILLKFSLNGVLSFLLISFIFLTLRCCKIPHTTNPFMNRALDQQKELENVQEFVEKRRTYHYKEFLKPLSKVQNCHEGGICISRSRGDP
jgi:hypothetical protein